MSLREIDSYIFLSIMEQGFIIYFYLFSNSLAQSALVFVCHEIWNGLVGRR